VGLLFREELEAEGYDVDLARDAQGLLQRLALSRPDLLVLDLGLGATDGRDVLVELRESYPDLPVIIWSGYDLAPSEARDLSAVFVAKSFDLGPLKKAISRLLKRPWP